MRWILIVMLASCTDSKPLPSCVDVGCPSGILCTRAGACTCDGVACRREPGDAGVDANAESPAAFAAGAGTEEVDTGDHDEGDADAN